jgi:hypothetical protein
MRLTLLCKDRNFAITAKFELFYLSSQHKIKLFMKKFTAYFVLILFTGILSFSVIAFAGDGPNKQKAEKAVTSSGEPATATTEQKVQADGLHHNAGTAITTEAHDTCTLHAGAKAACAEHADKAVAKACCDEAGKTAKGECSQKETCKHHTETAASE